MGKFVSIEDEINRTIGTYYDALQQSFAGWNEGTCDYVPFASYIFGVAACRLPRFRITRRGRDWKGQSLELV